MAVIVLCVCGGEKENSTPLVWDFLQLSFVGSQQLQKMQSWLISCLLFLLHLFISYTFILPSGGGGRNCMAGISHKGREMDIRNLVLTFSLVVLVGCFSVLVCSGPVFGQEAFSYSSGLWGSKKRGDNGPNGIAVTLTFYCISLIKFIPSG